MAKTVFYSFHYNQDVHRVQMVRNINALEGQPLLNAQDWEEIKEKGNDAVKAWIDEQMKYKKAVIVLIGQGTASREWIIYEIEEAWRRKRPLLGVRIHSLSSMGSIDHKGANPFEKANIDGANIPVFDPTRKDIQGRTDSQATYNVLKQNLEGWSNQGVFRN